MTLTPLRATFAPGSEIELEWERPNAAAGVVEISHLDRRVIRQDIPAGTSRIVVPALPVGGYGVLARTAESGDGDWSAFDVLDDAFDRPRYGFVVAMTEDVDDVALVRNFRRNHLNIAQFYDWAYRHSELMPPQESYLDPLGQARTLSGVNALARALAGAAVVPLGYTAVYGVGTDERDRWQDSLLLRADGEPYQFGEDFLLIVDPAERTWLAHYLDQLEAMMAGTDFAGFHLDQYGWPKRAVRKDGTRVDLAESFVALIAALRKRLPQSRFMFNNVNDFPVELTAGTEQDATYIEVWDPHSGLGDLGTLALKARALRPGRPPILSAYLSCYSEGDPLRADAAARLAMASIFSHGATHLLLGESGNVLVHAYYPNSKVLPAKSTGMFVRWYDFLVRYGDLLMDPAQQDVTEQFAGGVNEEFMFESGSGVVFSTKAEPGTVWTRVVRTSRGFVVHLINLTGQQDVTWDALKNEPTKLTGLALRVIPVSTEQPVPFAADPDGEPGLKPLSVVPSSAGEFNPLTGAQTAITYALPPLSSWLMVWLPDESTDDGR